MSHIDDISPLRVKAIRNKFREAVDSSCRSGHGRVVMLYYELCEKIWGGGLENTEIVPEVRKDMSLSVIFKI